MCDCALKSEELTSDLQSFGEFLARLCTLDADVVVPMTDLGSAARTHNIHLCSETMVWSQPGGRDERKPGVGVVFDEGGRILNAVFGEGIPDAGIRARGRKVVAFLS
jgi:hypothetical protein